MNHGMNQVEHNGRTINVRVEVECPPIPIRDFDYYAVDDDTYDGDPDSRSPIGWGATPDAAVADLLETMDEREN